MSSKSYLPHTWVDSRLIVRESKIEGKGVFTTKPVKEGEVLMVWGGVKILKKDLDETTHRLQTIVPIDEETYLGLPVTDTTKTADEYLNHSCDPNAWLVSDVKIVARRNIRAGEEITVDFATWDDEEDWPYVDEGECRCGSRLCRKKLTPGDWMRPELQKRYRGHFSPYLEKRIKNMRG